MAYMHDNLFSDDLLDLLFTNTAARRTFNARQSAEKQYDDSARESWLRRNTAGPLKDDNAKP